MSRDRLVIDDPHGVDTPANREAARRFLAELPRIIASLPPGAIIIMARLHDAR